MQVQYAVRAATLKGVEAIPVDVEVLVSSGLPAFSIVGMPDAAIQEARERVRAAIRACGFVMPSEKVIVNLAPGSIRKAGSGFDLPIAVGILAATKQIPSEGLDHMLLVGELSLEGQVRSVAGLLAYAVCARNIAFDLVCAQPEDGLIALENLQQFTVTSLKDFRTRDFAMGVIRAFKPKSDPLDYSDVAGHETAKRALQVAAAGGHGVLMMGPPGSGKTMLASRLPSILPPLTESEKLETALVHSVAGLDISSQLAGIRPFRKPHHSASSAGLIGGGSVPRPGEVSLAHNGVLFLDELPEFKPSTLQGIRQPMESGEISVIRVEGKIVFPAQFMLVAASNPCPCGYYGDEDIHCSCSATQVNNYQNRIGGPLLDRIDIHIDVWRGKPGRVIKPDKGISSHELREGVMKAREYANYRKALFNDTGEKSSQASLLSECRLGLEEENFMENMATAYHMSGRGIMRTLSIARTIADMEECLRVQMTHVNEALSLRIQEGIGLSHE